MFIFYFNRTNLLAGFPVRVLCAVDTTNLQTSRVGTAHITPEVMFYTLWVMVSYLLDVMSNMLSHSLYCFFHMHVPIKHIINNLYCIALHWTLFMIRDAPTAVCRLVPASLLMIQYSHNTFTSIIAISWYSNPAELINVYIARWSPTTHHCNIISP